MTHRVIQGYFRTGLAIPVRQTAQMKSTAQTRPGVNAFPVVLRAAMGGMPLPKEVQTKMESALGASFSDVRIHVGPEAASVGAIAFTWGSNIHFAPGHYNPGTSQGQELLGHELVHVLQQRAGRVTNPFGNGVAVVQDVALEAEADRVGRQASRWVAPVAPRAAGATAAVNSGVVSRKVDPAAHYQRGLAAMPNRSVVPGRMPSPLRPPAVQPQARATFPAVIRNRPTALVPAKTATQCPHVNSVVPAQRVAQAFPASKLPADVSVLQRRTAGVAPAGPGQVIQPWFGYDPIGGLRSVGNYLSQGASSATGYVSQGVTGAAGYAWQGLKEGANYLAEGVKDPLRYAAEGVTGAFGYQVEGLKGVASNLSQGGTDLLSYGAQGAVGAYQFLAQGPSAHGGYRAFGAAAANGVGSFLYRGGAGALGYLGQSGMRSLRHAGAGVVGSWNYATRLRAIGPYAYRGATEPFSYGARGVRGTGQYLLGGLRGGYAHGQQGAIDAYNQLGLFRSVALGTGLAGLTAGAFWGAPLAGLAVGAAGPYAADFMQALREFAWDPEGSGYHTTEKHWAWYTRGNMRGRLQGQPFNAGMSNMKTWYGARVDTQPTSSKFISANWQRYSRLRAMQHVKSINGAAVFLDYKPHPQAPNPLKFTIHYPNWVVGLSYAAAGPQEGTPCSYALSTFIQPPGAPNQYFLVQHFPQTGAYMLPAALGGGPGPNNAVENNPPVFSYS